LFVLLWLGSWRAAGGAMVGCSCGFGLGSDAGAWEWVVSGGRDRPGCRTGGLCVGGGVLVGVHRALRVVVGLGEGCRWAGEASVGY